MKSAKIIFTVLCGFLIGVSALAGEFKIHCFADLGECASKIEGLVSEKFTRHYPASHFHIVVIAEFQPYGSGGGVGYALAGVSPLLEDGTTQFPIHRFATTVRINDRVMGPYDVAEETAEVMRRSVEQMMAVCDRSPDCAVHIPYPGTDPY
ncbi:hypothetical protein OOT00_05265 [Desulfobotulus sp. H1]|uniref:Uncharacterized protein n=1 Tax=Desulfobotulus pelophilus TaxID=2823377 RepID=A0ABT3N7G3_9BACT|nr:hypothetical protein [Desulfobotulus pelophilus]MCW7753394.1 hypothetical protein [Desulfobotulus pelophilus]